MPMTAPGEPRSIDVASAALVIVDVQNAFCHPEGTRAGAVGPDAAEPTFAIVPVIGQLVDLARGHHLPVWFTRQEYWPDDRAAARRRIGSGLDRSGTGLDVCRAGTWDAEIVEMLERRRQPGDHVVVKHRASAFYQTALEQQLRMRGITTLLVTGTTTSYCVEATIRDAHARDFDVVVPAEAVADTDPQAQRASLAVIDRFHGLVCSVRDLPAMLGAPEKPRR